MLLNQADARSRAKLWKWRELRVRSASMMYSSPSRRCPYPDHPRRWLLAGLWVIPVWRQFIYDWRLLKLSATVSDDWCCLMHALASSSFGRWASPGVERPDAWQINCWYRNSHAHFTRTHSHPPLVSVYRFPTICSEAVCPHTAYQIVVGGQTAPCLSIGTITKKSIGRIPIPPNTGEYWPMPNTGIVGTLVVCVNSLSAVDSWQRFDNFSTVFQETT